MFFVFDTESKGTLTSVFGIKKQHSAMNPMLWIIGIAGLSCCAIVRSDAAPEWAKIMSMSIFAIVVVAAIGIYIYFAVKKPEYLRSDHYHATHDVLSYCERTQANPDNVVTALTNTVNPKLEDKKQ